ncbi:MAG: NADH-quinone oxidoreductase subunit C [Acidimicrobiia bacterium]
MSDAPAEEAVPEAVDAPPEPERRHGVPVTRSRGQEVLHPRRDELVGLVRTLRDDDGFVMCADVTGVDYLTYEADRGLPDDVAAERFEVVVLLRTVAGERVRLRVQVPADDPTCPSLFDVHPGSEAPEREAYDMFGIRFEGHPDMTRILMPEDWEGHPLRKDYAQGRIPVQFKAATNVR